MTFGSYLRKKRESLKVDSSKFSIRQVAARIGVEPAYLSKIERDEVPPPSEVKIIALALELNEDPDLLLAMAGKVSKELIDVILDRPIIFGELIRQLKSYPANAILSIVREVRDGEW